MSGRARLSPCVRPQAFGATCSGSGAREHHALVSASGAFFDPLHPTSRPSATAGRSTGGRWRDSSPAGNSDASVPGIGLSTAIAEPERNRPLPYSPSAIGHLSATGRRRPVCFAYTPCWHARRSTRCYKECRGDWQKGKGSGINPFMTGPYAVEGVAGFPDREDGTG